MKLSVSPHMVALLILSAVLPISAQNLVSSLRPSETSHKAEILDGSSEKRFTEGSALPGRYEVPAVEKVQGELPDVSPVYAAQSSATLDLQDSGSRKVESVVDLNVLRAPSPYRSVAAKNGPQPYEIATDSLQTGLAMISAVYREAGKTEDSSDCLAVAMSVEQQIRIDVSKVLQIVEEEVSANPACACEIVKTAIKASDADVALVVAIVETSITAAPDSMRIISQCAIAAMPESIAAVQALLAKLDPNSGDAGVYSSKSSKGAKTAEVASIESPAQGNPLDLPPAPPLVPPFLVPPPVTDVNPSVEF